MVHDHEISWIINTSLGQRTTEDSYRSGERRSIMHIPYTTTANGAAAFVSAMQALS